LLFWARLPMMLLATFGGLVVLLWARDMFGPAAGLFALSLYAFSPNLLAHGMLVTTDVPVAVFMTLALYLCWKQSSSIAVGLAIGAAMAAKFSGAILPLVVIGFSVWRVMSAEDRKAQAVRETRHLTIAGISALAMLEASYFFTVPPWTYLENMRIVNANHNPNHLFYLFGNFSRTGWWYYFPMAFAVKATIPVLISIVLAIVHLACKRFIDRRGEVLIFSTICAYAGAVMLGADDLGVRYLLPVFPLLFVWSSRFMRELNSARAGLILAVVLVGWQAKSALEAFPNYIPYFNEIAGGADGGIYYLDDSNVDWGQGMKQAVDYIREKKLGEVELLPFSPFDHPRYYGVNRPARDDIATYRMLISGEPLKPGTYIISAHHLTRMMYIRPEWDPRKAVGTIGGSMWVFKF
jgi:4-amino-4-deoxy-L-arabinose transferase-like glycosyltransferase